MTTPDFQRRCLLAAAVATIAVGPLLVAAPAVAADWPGRPIRIIVPFAPGGTLDVAARSMAVTLTESLKQPVIVENKPGAGGSIGATFVAKSPPDGYTLLLALRTLAISPAVIANLPYDPVKDFEPITLTEATYWVFCATPSLPVKNVQELIALAKSKPSGINYAGTGIGGDNHLTMEQFKKVTGAPITQIPYAGGGPAVVAMLAGQVDVMLVPGALSLQHIKAGKLKPLAILGAKRSPALPDVPTMTESGVPGFEGGSWTGLFAPKGTPPEVIQILNVEVRKALEKSRENPALYVEGIQVPGGSTPAELAAIMREDVVKWRRMAEEIGIKPE
jgi:tripartite-type tricarboxylate transporter receptor subunit TctC